MSKGNELPIFLAEDQAAWEEWLEDNHDRSTGVRLQIAKNNSGVATVTYDEALDIALCFGWIDSRKESYDDKTWLQRFTPRGPKSVWSQVNKEKAERLIASGRIKPLGMKAIDIAKANGHWDGAYEPQSRATVPDDFAAELERSPSAKAFFETLNRVNRYAILYRIGNVKKTEARAKKIRQFIEMLEKGEKIYP